MVGDTPLVGVFLFYTTLLSKKIKMEMIYQYVGITVFYLCLVVGMLILSFYIFGKIMDFLSKHFVTLWIMFEYGFYRKDFKRYMEEKKRERHPKVKQYFDSNFKWKKVRIRQGWFLIQYGNSNKFFSIEDYHDSGDYTGPMKFKSDDADKLIRFLNNYYKGGFEVVYWTRYDRMKRQLGLSGGVYAKGYKQEIKENENIQQ
jgi:hypothetical protein